ncbi:MAG: helix-turn-helix transcriptional regulator [Pseudomonadota bacterium]
MPSEIRKTLAKNIRRIAMAKKMSINALADFADVSRSQLYDILSSRKGATVDWIEKIADALEVSVADLFVMDQRRK